MPDFASVLHSRSTFAAEGGVDGGNEMALISPRFSAGDRVDLSDQAAEDNEP